MSVTTTVSSALNAQGICTHEQRVQHARNHCHKHRSYNRDYSNLIRYWYFIVSGRNLSYCVISKAACTTWKTLMLNSLQNKSAFTTHRYIHQPKQLRKFGLDKQTLDYFLNNKNLTQFVVVRHPFERVLSAYHNLIDVTKRHIGPISFRRYFMKKYNLNRNIQNLKLEQFINEITSTNLRLSNIVYDRHWLPYIHSCDPCQIDFDYIIKMETMSHWGNNDASEILKILGYQADTLSLVRMNPSNKGPSFSQSNNTNSRFEKLLQEYKEVSPKLMDRLVKKYSTDMQLYGYKFDQNSLIASCEIQIGPNATCC